LREGREKRQERRAAARLVRLRPAGAQLREHLLAVPEHPRAQLRPVARDAEEEPHDPEQQVGLALRGRDGLEEVEEVEVRRDRAA